DTGIGIPNDKLDDVFGEFHQVENEKDRAHDGTGLGLAISARLVSLMGGEIWVDSEEGRGSGFGFQVSLPAAGVDEEAPEVPEWMDRAIVVGPDSLNRAILLKQLNMLGLNPIVMTEPEGIEELNLTRHDLFFVSADAGGDLPEFLKRLRQSFDPAAIFLLADSPGLLQPLEDLADATFQRPVLRNDMRACLRDVQMPVPADAVAPGSEPTSGVAPEAELIAGFAPELELTEAVVPEPWLASDVESAPEARSESDLAVPPEAGLQNETASEDDVTEPDVDLMFEVEDSEPNDVNTTLSPAIDHQVAPEVLGVEPVLSVAEVLVTSEVEPDVEAEWELPGGMAADMPMTEEEADQAWLDAEMPLAPSSFQAFSFDEAQSADEPIGEIEAMLAPHETLQADLPAPGEAVSNVQVDPPGPDVPEVAPVVELIPQANEAGFDANEPEFDLIDTSLPPKDAPPLMRVLVAEDNKTNRLVMEKMLKDLNIDLVFAENGEVAIEQFLWQRPDLMFTDISMPKLDGKEAARRIRVLEEEAQADRCPIVAITAHALEGDAEEILAAGIDHYMTKPVKKADLVAYIVAFCPTNAQSVQPEDQAAAAASAR
ncbi:MAG: response regulator, partial [Pseudomonadota bacterium]